MNNYFLEFHKIGVLNNKDLQCLPRAEINNSLTGKVGKQAVRDRDAGEHRRNLAGEEALWGWNQPWGQQMLGHLDTGAGVVRSGTG